MRVMMEAAVLPIPAKHTGFISPPIAAAFLLGLFIKRINAKGYLVPLDGLLLGIARLILEFRKSR